MSHHHHHHEHSHNHAHKTLKVSIILTVFILLFTIIGGIFTKSLSLLGDAAHIFTDLFSLIISMVSTYIATRKPNKKYNFGMDRIGVVASIINIVLLILSCSFIFYEAIKRFINPVQLNTSYLFMFAIIGLIFNLIILFKLHSHNENNLNIESAFWHILGDTLSSVGIVILSLIMLFCKNSFILYLDPVMSIIITCVIGYGVVRLSKKVFFIIMDSVPEAVDVNKVINKIESVYYISQVHNIKIREIINNDLEIQLQISLHTEIDIFNIKKDIKIALEELNIKDLIIEVI